MKVYDDNNQKSQMELDADWLSSAGYSTRQEIVGNITHLVFYVGSQERRATYRDGKRIRR